MWGDGWTGCKLWGGCGGTRCKSTDGRPWGTPVRYPTERAPGIHPERARHGGCPLTLVEPQDWGTLQLWGAWRQLGGLPSPGCVEDQDARLVDAFALLDGEQDMINAAFQEEFIRRARSKR